MTNPTQGKAPQTPAKPKAELPLGGALTPNATSEAEAQVEPVSQVAEYQPYVAPKGINNNILPAQGTNDLSEA